MAIDKYISRIKYIDYLISHKATGNLLQLSRKLQLGKRATIEYLNIMKDLGFPIKYSRSTSNYYYETKGKMVDCFFVAEE